MNIEDQKINATMLPFSQLDLRIPRDVAEQLADILKQKNGASQVFKCVRKLPNVANAA
jgi:hypothetical protein